MNLRIKPERIFRKGIATSINWSIASYERNSTSVQVAWTVFDENNNPLDSDIETFGNDVVSEWDTSDAVIDDALLTKLELQRDEA